MPLPSPDDPLLARVRGAARDIHASTRRARFWPGELVEAGAGGPEAVAGALAALVRRGDLDAVVTYGCTQGHVLWSGLPDQGPPRATRPCWRCGAPLCPEPLSVAFGLAAPRPAEEDGARVVPIPPAPGGFDGLGPAVRNALVKALRPRPRDSGPERRRAGTAGLAATGTLFLAWALLAFAAA